MRSLTLLPQASRLPMLWLIWVLNISILDSYVSMQWLTLDMSSRKEDVATRVLVIVLYMTSLNLSVPDETGEYRR